MIRNLKHNKNKILFSIILAGLMVILTNKKAFASPVPDPPNPAQNWVNSNVIVNLSNNGDVPSVAVSEVNRIEYKLSGAKNQDWIPYTAPLRITDEGITAISSRVVDNAGNYSNTTVETVKIDKSTPYLLVQADTSLLTNPTVKIKVTATDLASGIKRIQLPDGNWTTNTSLTYEVSKDGVYTFVAEDVYGFRTTQSISINNISRNTLITNKPQVKLKLGADDSLSGITQMQFRNEYGSWSPFEPYSTLKHWTVSNGDGLKHVWVQYADQVGNISQTVEDTVILDTTAPTIQSFTINGGKQHTNNKNVLLRVNATDNLTGMKSLMISNDGLNWTTMDYTTSDIPWTLTDGDGIKTVYLKASDIAGNITALNTASIFVDTVKPTASILINNGDAYSATRDVNLTLNFADNIGGSGIAQVKVIEGSHSYTFPSVPSSPVTIPWILDYGVVKTVSVQVTDKAGNVSDLASDSITVDKLTINNFSLTNVVNPISFTESNPYKGLTWSFEPQPMMAGGNISFNLNIKAPYEPSVVTDSATFKVDIIGDNGYHKVITDNLDNKTANNYSKTITLPVDAPKDAKVYASCVATRKLLVSPYDTQTAYFPGYDASTQAQIGYIEGNIYDSIKFNETN